MPVLISDEELEKLKGLPFIQSCLYMFGIRPYMDYKTGITGIKRKISYQSLSEEIYIEPHQGIKNTGSKSREQIRRAVKALERVGVVTIQSNSKNLILKCNLAITDKSAQNKADTKPTPQLTTQADTSKTAKTSEKSAKSQPKADTQADIPQNEKADTPPISDTLHNITLPSAFEFLNLLAQQGYGLNQLHNNKTTLAMVHAWVKAKVTLEEAQIGINHVNAQRGSKPDTPSYYTKPILQVRKDFEKANQQVEEITNADNTTNPSRPVRSNYPQRVTQTQGFYDECLPAVNRNRQNRKPDRD